MLDLEFLLKGNVLLDFMLVSIALDTCSQALAPPPSPSPRPLSSFLLRVKEWRGIELKALAPAQNQIQIIGS